MLESGLGDHTVRTVAADLRHGEPISKMQNNIGRKSTLRVLRQRRSKDGRGAMLDDVPYRSVPCRAARRLARRWVMQSCHRFKLDWILRRRQKHHDGLEPTSFWTTTWYSTNCATLTLWNIYSWHNPHYTVQCTILYYTILYYMIRCYTILYYTKLYYIILKY